MDKHDNHIVKHLAVMAVEHVKTPHGQQALLQTGATVAAVGAATGTAIAGAGAAVVGGVVTVATVALPLVAVGAAAFGVGYGVMWGICKAGEWIGEKL